MVKILWGLLYIRLLRLKRFKLCFNGVLFVTNLVKAKFGGGVDFSL
jgi:hypothetical protein